MAAPLGVSLRGINLAVGNHTNAKKSATFLTHLTAFPAKCINEIIYY